MTYLFPALFAFILTVFLTVFALWLFPKLKMLDRPEKYGLTRKPIPYYGGLVLVAVFIISVLIFVKLDTRVIGLITGGLMIAGVSFLDDLKNLNPWIRLFVQFLGALTVVLAGIGIDSITNPFGGAIELDKVKLIVPFGENIMQFALLADLFTIAWIILIINTMNFLDGLNGLVSGVSFIASLTVFALSIGDFNIVDQTTIATLAIIAASMCLAFWIFDFYPAKILMGDTGSMFLGYLLAVFAIFSGGKIATAFLVLGFPILDAFWVISRRIIQGKSPMKGDTKHLHHRLLEVGLSDRKALLLIYLLCAFFGGSAVFLGSMQKLYMIIAMGVLMLIMATIILFYSLKKVQKSG
ncbi:undecaprenyl/decaprenyl-phosphate alpha-N-acetylglucosaminyl 1-phosphate transferase [Candidatus Peregrinibacteria bacterium]|nr:undecaprenyl/decaprenyl-phosphate alpha-N-acetylglucosaminyl 1-phosphate transferase [Candidatus Peregrinibacteria bacterium]